MMTPLEVAGLVVRDEGVGYVAINYVQRNRTEVKLLEILNIKDGAVSRHCEAQPLNEVMLTIF